MTEESLFYTYNPKGFSEKKRLPVGFCQHCRCPENYCCEVVFGEICEVHAYQIMYENGSLSDSDTSDMKFYFNKAFTIAVQNKMRINKIKFPLGSTSLDVYKTPECMNRRSVRRYIRQFRRDKKQDGEYPAWSDLDMKEGEPIGPQNDSD